MATALKLELSEIEELRLKFADGLDVQGRYGACYDLQPTTPERQEVG